MSEVSAEVLLTIRDASRATGLSVKAIRRRVERGTLPAQLVGGIRRVPMSELMAAGLLVTRPEDRRHEPAVASPGVEALARRVAELEGRVTELEAERLDVVGLSPSPPGDGDGLLTAPPRVY